MRRALSQYGSVVLLWLLASGCADSEEPDFGRAELEASFYGTWTGTWQELNAEPVELRLEIRAPDEAPLESQCSQRALSLSPQCMDTTSMAVAATVTLPAQVVTLDGTISVYSLTLTHASLSFFREGAPFALEADWTREGWRSCQALEGRSELATCTIDQREQGPAAAEP